MEKLKLYIYGRSENTIYFADVPEHIIVAFSEKTAYEILNKLDDFDQNISLNKIVYLDEIMEGDIIL